MSHEWKALLFLVITLFIVYLIEYYEQITEKERIRQLKRLAIELGLDFTPQIDNPTLLNLESFDLFSWGYSKHASNLIQGRINGLGVLFLDYAYRPFLGKVTIRQSVICFGLPENRLPVFQQGYSEKVIQKLFVRELRKLGKERSGVNIEVSKNYFIYYRQNAYVRPKKMLAFWEEGVDVLSLYLDFASKPVWPTWV